MPDSKYFYENEGSNNIPKWERGQFIETNRTRNIRPEDKELHSSLESRIIIEPDARHSNGGRMHVCTLNYAHPEFEFNRALIEAAPSLLRAVCDLNHLYGPFDFNTDIEKLMNHLRGF